MDASIHEARAADETAFGFNHGPARRYVGSPRRFWGWNGRSALPGGESGVLGSPRYANLLGRWLTNDSYRLRQRPMEVFCNATERWFLLP